MSAGCSCGCSLVCWGALCYLNTCLIIAYDNHIEHRVERLRQPVCVSPICLRLLPQVGMGATLLDGVVMEPGSIVAAGAVVPPGVCARGRGRGGKALGAAGASVSLLCLQDHPAVGKSICLLRNVHKSMCCCAVLWCGVCLDGAASHCLPAVLHLCRFCCQVWRDLGWCSRQAAEAPLRGREGLCGCICRQLRTHRNRAQVRQGCRVLCGVVLGSV